MPKIKGGYILQPRVIDESSIAKSPPHVREIWMYILRRANHADCPEQRLRRGQLRTSYREILADLSWTVGYRKESYKKTQCEIAMRVLTREGMITTAKSTRGMVITVCKYDYYQNPDHYVVDKVVDNEVDNETDNESTGNTRRIKNDNNDNKNTDTKVSLSNAEHSTQEKLNYDEVVNFFNSKTNGVFGLVRLPISDKRKSAIRARIREHGKIAFGEVVAKATNSDFLKGSTRFKATFDWIIKPDNFSKILEGNYDNRKNNENNGNNGITAKQQQRQQVVRDVHQDVLDEILYGENK